MVIYDCFYAGKRLAEQVSEICQKIMAGATAPVMIYLL